MARNKFTFDGFKELEANLKRIEKAASQKSATRNAMKAALQPTINEAISNAPEASGDLKESLQVGTRLNKHQAKLERKEGKDDVTVYAGSSDVGASWIEFGTQDQAPQPFLRPAWESTKDNILPALSADMARRIDKAIKRQIKAAAKKGGGK